jgi:predicted transcriptional regulator
MANKKMTYSQALEIAIAVVEGEAKERLVALKASVDKRNSADRKPTKTQEANEAIKADILDFLSDGEKHTVTEIMAGVPSLAKASNQKAASLVKQLKESGAIVHEEIKRKAYFSLA